MDDLRITWFQLPLEWEKKEENLRNLTSKIDAIAEATDVLVLPEMFSTGFSMNSAVLAEKIDGASVNWMQEQAAKKNCVITGSLIIEENAKFYNRLIWMRADGSFDVYDKRHLFRMANENKHFSGGNKKLIVTCNGWKICLMVCYDLRFPVWSRRTENENYDALIYVANWPEKRSHAWKSLLIARAIENQAYVVGVNRMGTDGNNISYSGDSVALNYLGEPISATTPNRESCESIVLKKEDLIGFRASFPAEKDADTFSIELGD